MKLAVDGGAPVRSSLLPYARQWIDEADVEAVVAALRSDWLTTGPRVGELEDRFRERTGTAHAVAVSSGTAALHTALAAMRVGPGDEVIVPPMTFAATAACVAHLGARPVFADVDAQTLLLDPQAVRIGPRTRAVIGVDYAGQPCDYEALASLGVPVLADACHALGASSHGKPVGALADGSCFSLHPTKAVTGGEGGVITTDDAELAARARRFRNHGIDLEHRVRTGWAYSIAELGLNYRLTDVGCALAASQLGKLDRLLARRRALAARYDQAFAGTPWAPLARRAGATHAYHLYVVRLDLSRLSAGRERIFQALRAEGIGVNVHYVPVHTQPAFRERFGTKVGDCPIAEEAYERLLTLPLFPAMTDRDAADVIEAVRKVGDAYAA